MNVSKMFYSLFFKTNLTAFRSAILADDVNKICRILDVEREHLFKELDNEGNTALLLAIQYSSTLTVRILLEQGAQPDQANFLTFQTPLSLLASTTYDKEESHQAKLARELATILLDHGAYVDKPSPYTCTDENGKDYSTKETPLMTAVRTQNLSMATLFVERKANVNYSNKQTENRSIHICITNSDTAMFDLLENAGAHCRSVLTKGENTLLHCFCYHRANDKHMPLLERLINTDCDVNAENDLHRTPLMLAARLDMINTCQLLLSYSADVNKVDNQGYRAVDLATRGSECFKLLQKAKETHPRHVDQILWKKTILPTRACSKRPSNSTNFRKINENKIHAENHRWNGTNPEEFDTKYKRMWERLLQTKEKIRRVRDTSLPRRRDCSLSRKRDPSPQNDTITTVDL